MLLGGGGPVSLDAYCQFACSLDCIAGIVVRIPACDIRPAVDREYVQNRRTDWRTDRSTDRRGIDTATGPATIVTTGSELEAAVAAKVAAIHLGAGEYVVNTTLVLAPSTMLSGVGQASRIRASGSFNRSRPVIAIGNNVGPAAGVTIRDLVVDCDSKALIGIAIEGIAAHDYQGELDSMCRLDNLWVYDSVGDGVLYAGRDSRSVISTRVRVRRAGRHGFHIRNSDSWWIGCEATTRTPTGGTAGFFINAGASNFFEACKAWYCRDFGWRVSGVRNKFIGCEAQDTRLHGWNIEWDRNVFTGCVADSAGMYDVGGSRTQPTASMLPPQVPRRRSSAASRSTAGRTGPSHSSASAST